MIQIKKVTDLNTFDITTILESSLSEGYRFIRRLIEEYKNGTNRFDKKGEILLIIELEKQVIGIGGLNIDPYLNEEQVGRIRHIYIDPKHRGKRIGKQLVELLVEESSKDFKKLRLLTENPIADQLYQKVGFKKVEGHYKASHVLER